MAATFRGFATSAAHFIAEPRTWMGRAGIQLQNLDKVHYDKKDAEHMERCVEYCKEGILKSGINKIEAR